MLKCTNKTCECHARSGEECMQAFNCAGEWAVAAQNKDILLLMDHIIWLAEDEPCSEKDMESKCNVMDCSECKLTGNLPEHLQKILTTRYENKKKGVKP